MEYYSCSYDLLAQLVKNKIWNIYLDNVDFENVNNGERVDANWRKESATINLDEITLEDNSGKKLRDFFTNLFNGELLSCQEKVISHLSI
jgi:hypothetical protein